jgi:DNA invertase Pin-like site-specific DNA recombinase
MNYLNSGNWTLAGEFTEIESGKRNDRPELVNALAACKKQKAKLGGCQETRDAAG